MSVLIKRMTGTMAVETAEAERGKPACSKYATNGCVRRSGPSPVRNAATHELTSRIDKVSDVIEICYILGLQRIGYCSPRGGGGMLRRHQLELPAKYYRTFPERPFLRSGAQSAPPLLQAL